MTPVSKVSSRDASASVQLRTYVPADFSNLYIIDQACYEPRIAYSRTELRQYLRFPGAGCVVAEAMQQNFAVAAQSNYMEAMRKNSAEAVPKSSAETTQSNPAPPMVGFCITAHKAGWGYIVTMDVLLPYRRHGIGSMLLVEAERRLIAAGVRQIGLETATDNSAAIAFWQKHGYRKIGIRKGYYPDGRDAFAMTKPIAR